MSAVGCGENDKNDTTTGSSRYTPEKRTSSKHNCWWTIGYWHGGLCLVYKKSLT